LWNRLAAFDPADLDAAFAGHAVVKATLMRITLHAVHADDYPALHSAMLPSLRAARLHDRRYTGSGLSIADADALLPELLEFAARPRGKDEVEELLAARLGDHKPRAWWALRTFAPLLHVPAVVVRFPVVVRGGAGPVRRGASPGVGAAAGAALPGGVRSGLGGGRRPVHPAHAVGGAGGPARDGRGAGEAAGAGRGRSCSTCPGRRSRPRTPPLRRGCCQCGTASCWAGSTAAG
jgi:DNA glycosylase AlkZ-like